MIHREYAALVHPAIHNIRSYLCDWVIRKAEIEFADTDGIPFKRWLEVNYKDGPGGHPIITADRLWSTGKDKKGVFWDWEQKTKFDLQVTPALPESAFTLGAYGLPEPFGMEAPRRRWYLWAAGAGLICLMAGAWLWIRQRRAQPS